MTKSIVFSNDGQKAYWDARNKTLTLVDGTQISHVSGYPDTFSDISSMISIKSRKFLVADRKNHRLVLVNKDIAKPFGPVMYCPYGIAYADNLIYVLTYPDGVIEPSVVTVLDDKGNPFGYMYQQDYINAERPDVMYSKDYENPDFKIPDPGRKNEYFTAIRAEGNDIVLKLKSGEEISFAAKKPQNSMIERTGFRHVISTSRTVTHKQPVFSYTIDNLAVTDAKNTSMMPNEDPAFQNNIGYSVENFGDKDVYVYSMSCNNKNYANMPSLIDMIVKGCTSDKQKIYAIWNFIRTHISKGVSWPVSFSDDGSFSAIRFINSMGSGKSDSFNCLFHLMAQAAGITSRHGFLADGSHYGVRLSYNLKDKYADAYAGGCDQLSGSLLCDETNDLYDYEDLCKDPARLKMASDDSSYLFSSMLGHNDMWYGWSDDYFDPFTMGYYLKAGEKMEFSFCFNGTYTGTGRPHANIVTGQKTFLPDKSTACRKAFELSKMKMEGNVFTSTVDTVSRAIFSSQCPYPVTAIMIEGKLYSGTLDISSDFAKDTFKYEDKREFCAFIGNTGAKSLTGPVHEIYLEFKAYAAKFRIHSITIFFQANRTTLCELKSGVNELSIETEPGDIRVSHSFVYSAHDRPQMPTIRKSEYGAFSWSLAYMDSFEFILSEYPDCEMPYAPCFHRVIQDNRITIDLYEHLIPDKKYYWKVRGKNKKGVWGYWSKITVFKHIAPKKPEGLVIAYKDRDIRLVWTKDQEVASYIVYASNEPAFIPADKPYELNSYNRDTLKKKIIMPVNIVKQVKTPYLSLTSDDLKEDLKYCYRIKAVDKKGNMSKSSDYVCLNRPHILKHTVSTDAYAGIAYSCTIKCTSSDGMSRYDKNTGTIYNESDILEYSLTGPDWLNIDSSLSYLSGTPGQSNEGVNSFVLGVTNQKGEKDQIKFDITVHPGI